MKLCTIIETHEFLEKSFNLVICPTVIVVAYHISVVDSHCLPHPPLVSQAILLWMPTGACLPMLEWGLCPWPECHHSNSTKVGVLLQKAVLCSCACFTWSWVHMSVEVHICIKCVGKMHLLQHFPEEDTTFQNHTSTCPHQAPSALTLPQVSILFFWFGHSDKCVTYFFKGEDHVVPSKQDLSACCIVDMSRNAYPFKATGHQALGSSNSSSRSHQANGQKLYSSMYNPFRPKQSCNRFSSSRSRNNMAVKEVCVLMIHVPSCLLTLVFISKVTSLAQAFIVHVGLQSIRLEERTRYAALLRQFATAPEMPFNATNGSMPGQS